MKKDKEILAKVKETIDLLGEDKREELLNYLSTKKKRSNLIKNVAVVYKLNVETEKMLAVGQASFLVGKKDYLVTLFPNPESQYKGIPNIKDAKGYYPDWFIENGKGGFIDIEPTNKINQIYVPSGFDLFPIGVISDQLSVTLFSSYEKLPQNKYNQ